MARASRLVAVVAVALLAGALLPMIAPGVGATPVPAPPGRHPGRAMTNVSYNSSVDGFPLSYEEVLPSHFRPLRTYPLLVYLHGAGHSSGVVRGGSGNGLSGGYLNASSMEGRTLDALLTNASSFGFIVIAPSPRSAQGFYTNSSCLGPGEQDTVDAIAHEAARRHIGRVYLLGDSMGSLGALSLAGHRPGLVSGIALTGTLTDAFEEYAYRSSPASSLLAPTCGVPPSSTNTTAQRLFAYLSVARFDPANFSGIPIWVAAGSRDRDTPNNASIWGFEMVNDTFLNVTCSVATSLAEPANCTVPFALLHAHHPHAFGYRFFYEPSAGHLISQLDPMDMFQFFEGKVGGGCVETTFPPSTLSACP